MPFLSKDWRSPGEKWVRFEGGWEMTKTLSSYYVTAKSSSCCNFNYSNHQNKSTNCIIQEESEDFDDIEQQQQQLVDESDKENSYTHTLPCKRKTSHEQHQQQQQQHVHPSNSLPSRDASHLTFMSPLQPYCHITVKSTKEIAGFNALADSLLRLDFISAVKDLRRFQYVSQIMFSLFSHDRLFQLPGAAQKVLFRMLEEMAYSVYKYSHGDSVLRKLMDELNATMTIYQVWGSHLGSSNLFRQHSETRRRIVEFAEQMQVKYKQDLATSSVHHAPRKVTPPGLVSALPEECIREILLRLSDPTDLQAAGKSCLTMETITKEKRVWRELVQTHFTKMQIESVLRDQPEFKDLKDWKMMYKKLRWKFGLKEKYTETLYLCKKCNALFWQSLGHPCLVLANREENNNNENEKSELDIMPILPKTFLGFFSV